MRATMRLRGGDVTIRFAYPHGGFPDSEGRRR